jgi:hypothetical protein
MYFALSLQSMSMHTHPTLIERSVGSTLCAFKAGRLTMDEAALDLIEIVASQIVGRTNYAMAVIGYYVRTALKALADKKLELPDVFDAIVDAAMEGPRGHVAASTRLAQQITRLAS